MHNNKHDEKGSVTLGKKTDETVSAFLKYKKPEAAPKKPRPKNK